jgi:hypothetical protein
MTIRRLVPFCSLFAVYFGVQFKIPIIPEKNISFLDHTEKETIWFIVQVTELIGINAMNYAAKMINSNTDEERENVKINIAQDTKSKRAENVQQKLITELKSSEHCLDVTLKSLKLLEDPEIKSAK